jgi:signal peptidase I
VSDPDDVRRDDDAGAAGSGDESPGSGLGGAIVEQVLTLVIAISIALTIRQLLVEPFRIPSGSMFPTLLVGDHLFVNKLAYGPRVPFTDLRLPGFREPERGDVVVFEVARVRTARGFEIMPLDRAPDGAISEDFIKRLVGLPGDEISWRDGRLFVNGVLQGQVAASADFVDDEGVQYRKSWEQLGACEHAILAGPRRAAHPRFERGTYIVEEGRYFFMGDNRDNSNDSRGWGSVRLHELKGPAFLLYWSWALEGNMLSFFNPVNWFTVEKRWDRVFQSVQCEDPAGADAR